MPGHSRPQGLPGQERRVPRLDQPGVDVLDGPGARPRPAHHGHAMSGSTEESSPLDAGRHAQGPLRDGIGAQPRDVHVRRPPPGDTNGDPSSTGSSTTATRPGSSARSQTPAYPATTNVQ